MELNGKITQKEILVFLLSHKHIEGNSVRLSQLTQILKRNKGSVLKAVSKLEGKGWILQHKNHGETWIWYNVKLHDFILSKLSLGRNEKTNLSGSPHTRVGSEIKGKQSPLCEKLEQRVNQPKQATFNKRILEEIALPSGEDLTQGIEDVRREPESVRTNTVKHRFDPQGIPIVSQGQSEITKTN